MTKITEVTVKLMYESNGKLPKGNALPENRGENTVCGGFSGIEGFLFGRWDLTGETPYARCERVFDGGIIFNLGYGFGKFGLKTCVGSIKTSFLCVFLRFFIGKKHNYVL